MLPGGALNGCGSPTAISIEFRWDLNKGNNIGHTAATIKY